MGELQAADTFTGERVVNRRGQELGTIEDVMIDVQHGTVAYVVMSCAGAAGPAEKLFAVPWGALRRDEARRAFVLDAERERFAQAPGFDRAHWPSMGDDRWARQVHGFWGVPPYWTAAADSGLQAAAARTLDE